MFECDDLNDDHLYGRRRDVSCHAAKAQRLVIIVQRSFAGQCNCFPGSIESESEEDKDSKSISKKRKAKSGLGLWMPI